MRGNSIVKEKSHDTQDLQRWNPVHGRHRPHDRRVLAGLAGIGQLYINRQLVASIDMPYSILNLWGTEGLTCGYDGGDRVAPDEYGDEFRFTGTLKRVTLDLSGELIPDTEADMKIAMARQ